MSQKGNTLKVRKSKGKINGTLQLLVLEENQFTVLYLPALNISGYGENYKEAYSLLKESMNDYFEYLISLSTKEIDVELRKLGWKKSSQYRKEVSLSETTFEDIKKMFDIRDDSDLLQLSNLSMTI